MSKTVPSQPHIVNTSHQNILCASVLLVKTMRKIAPLLEQTRLYRLTAPRIIKNTFGFKIATGGEN
jgi:hypothetical protein